MSITSEITRLQNAKSTLATSIKNKGVTVPSNATLDEYAALVDSIQTGGGGEGGTLPYDAEVEYLQSDGNQYIDTGVVADKNYVIITDCAVISGTSFPTVIGALSGSSAYSVILAYNASGQPYTQVTSNFATLYNISKLGSTLIHYICTGNSTRQYISDGLALASNTFSGNAATNSLYMFARHRYDTTVGNYAAAKIGKMRITVDGVLQRDYIPVRVGTVGYMYDKVSGELFGNDGSGYFTFGNDVTT